MSPSGGGAGGSITDEKLAKGGVGDAFKKKDSQFSTSKKVKIEKSCLLEGCEAFPPEKGGPGMALLKELEPIGP